MQQPASVQGHDLKIEVMQLSPPTFPTNNRLPVVSNSNPALVALNSKNLRSSPELLLLPSKLVEAHLGEVFKICCAVRRLATPLCESEKVRDLAVNCSMTKEKGPENVFWKTTDAAVLESTSDTYDFVASYDLRATGVHRMSIYCTYTVESIHQIDGSVEVTSKHIRKNYDIKVQMPLKITMNYPFHTVRTCLAEATLENCSASDMNLTQVALEPVEKFRIISSDDSKMPHYLRPGEKCLKSFVLAQHNGQPLVAGKHPYGRLSIIWKRKMSSVGRLQTSILDTLRKPDLNFEIVADGDSKRIEVATEPEPIGLLTPQPLNFSIINTSLQEIAIDINLKENEYNDPVKFIGCLEHKNVVLSPGQEKQIHTQYMSTRRGLHTIPPIICKDLNSHHTYNFTNRKKINVG